MSGPDGAGGKVGKGAGGRWDGFDDTALLVAARVDVAAFGALFDRVYPQVLTFFQVRVRRREVAADLAAETLAAALDGLEGFEPAAGSAAQWLFGIARNKLFRYWRDLRTSQDARDRLGGRALPVDVEPLEAMERVEVAQSVQGALLAALESLPDSQAAAVRLRVFDELSYDAIAAELGCAVGAARVRVHRGLRQLRVVYEQLDRP